MPWSLLGSLKAPALEPRRLLRDDMYYIGLDVHKKTISYCVKVAAGRVSQEGIDRSTRHELDAWIKTLPQPRMIAMEATIFTGWIYDHLLPHAEKVKVAHPLMLRAIAAAKRKNDQINSVFDKTGSFPERRLRKGSIANHSLRMAA
jgi:hypothetical protein